MNESRAEGQAVAQREPERVRAIVQAEHAFVWRSLRRLGVPADAVDDATQQVFLVLCRRIKDVGSGQERSFLFGSAVRVASEYRRKPFRHREVLDEEIDDRAGEAESPEKMLQQRQDRELLDAMLDELPMEQRTVFVLYELEELTMVAIAELIGIPQGTVASRLRLARERIEQRARELTEERAKEAT